MPSAALRRPAVLLTLLATLLVPLAGAALAEDPVPVPAPAPVAQSTTLRITAPSSVPTGSSADVWVRLVHAENGGEDPVAGATVLIQRESPSGWVQVASIATRDDG